MRTDKTMPTLVADLGGTNVRFALADTSAARPLIDASVRHYAVAEFASLTDAGQHYLNELNVTPERGVFAVAGKVGDEEIRITNHPWTISVDRTRRDLSLTFLHFINDFAAMSMAVPLLTANDIETIGEKTLIGGDAHTRTIGVIGPGTGLGVGAFLLRDGKPQILQTEGGHIGFAPSTDEEIQILQWLRKRYGKVSNERLICGSGLVNLYQSLCSIDGIDAQAFSPEQITCHARERSNTQCERVINVFCAVLGSIAGDLALTLGAWDGIYLAGGIVPLLLPWLHGGEFRRRFQDKGRFAATMQSVPTVAITYAYAGLLGAAGMK